MEGKLQALTGRWASVHTIVVFLVERRDKRDMKSRDGRDRKSGTRRPIDDPHPTGRDLRVQIGRHHSWREVVGPSPKGPVRMYPSLH